MKLGTSQRGTLVPALVAFTVLAGSVAFASRAERSPAPDPTTAVTGIQVGRWGHHGDDGPFNDPSISPSADPSQRCEGALESGSAAFGRSHGLERAIQVILDRCGRIPAARGLVNALARLAENRERQAANEHGVDDTNEHGAGPNEAGRGTDERDGTPKGRAADPPRAGEPPAHADPEAAGPTVGNGSSVGAGHRGIIEESCVGVPSSSPP